MYKYMESLAFSQVENYICTTFQINIFGACITFSLSNSKKFFFQSCNSHTHVHTYLIKLVFFSLHLTYNLILTNRYDISTFKMGFSRHVSPNSQILKYAFRIPLLDISHSNYINDTQDTRLLHKQNKMRILFYSN